MKNYHAETHGSGTYGEAVANQVDAMLAYWDKNQVCRFANNAYIDWFGKCSEEMIGKMTMKELLGPLYEKNLPYILGALAGQKQVFEREIPLPGGGKRHSLATYIPDITDGEVRGFFVHVADVSYIKELESKILRSRRETLRSVFETTERERLDTSTIIRDSVNQTLSYCKIILQQKMEKGMDTEFNEELLGLISQAIYELNSITVNLAPTSIEHFGFILGTEDYIDNFKIRHRIQVYFDCKNKEIETIEIHDKLSVFRIIQNFLMMVQKKPEIPFIYITVDYKEDHLELRLKVKGTALMFQKESAEFNEIENRVEYYGGTIEELVTDDERTILIDFAIQ